jgi:hypothetical protein
MWTNYWTVLGITAGEGYRRRRGRLSSLGWWRLRQAGRGGALVGGFAGVGFAGAGAFVFDVADREPDELDDSIVGRECPRFLMIFLTWKFRLSIAFVV